MLSYKVASNPGDYKAAHKLMRSEGVKDGRLQWPTVMALKGNTPVGLIGTYTQGDMIIAGPLVIKKGTGAVVAIRMAEAYEWLMRKAGVQWFVICVDNEQSFLNKIIERYFPEEIPYAVEDGKRFYIRKLN